MRFKQHTSSAFSPLVDSTGNHNDGLDSSGVLVVDGDSRCTCDICRRLMVEQVLWTVTGGLLNGRVCTSYGGNDGRSPCGHGNGSTLTHGPHTSLGGNPSNGSLD